jgi:hypothetical protein
VLVNLMIVTVLLWATVKIPGLMRRYVTGGRSSNVVAAVMRIAVVQQLGNVLRARAFTSGAARAAGRSLPPGAGGARGGGGGQRPRPTPVPPGGGGAPRPGQLPRFSHAPARHRPIPRPANVGTTPAMSHRQPAATPIPGPAEAPRPPGFSHAQPAHTSPRRSPVRPGRRSAIPLTAPMYAGRGPRRPRRYAATGPHRFPCLRPGPGRRQPPRPSPTHGQPYGTPTRLSVAAPPGGVNERPWRTRLRTVLPSRCS